MSTFRTNGSSPAEHSGQSVRHFRQYSGKRLQQSEWLGHTANLARILPRGGSVIKS